MIFIVKSTSGLIRNPVKMCWTFAASKKGKPKSLYNHLQFKDRLQAAE